MGVLTLGACSKSGSSEQSPTAQAQTLYAERCSTCHGKTGGGDGPGAGALAPKPRAFTDAAWQSSVSDAHLEQIIVGGGAAVGKSVLMPPNPDLEGEPEVLKAIIKIIRGFGPRG